MSSLINPTLGFISKLFSVHGRQALLEMSGIARRASRQLPS